MDMDVSFHEFLVGETCKFRMSLDVLESYLSRLLHDISEVSGHAELTLALAHRAFDEKDFSSHLGPCEAGNNARCLIALLNVMRVCRKSEIFSEMILLQNLRILLFEGDLLRSDTGYLCDLLLKSAYTGFTCVFINDLRKGCLVYTKLSLLESMLVQLLRYQIVLRNLHLLLSKVSAYIDHLHTVLESRLDVIDVIGSRDEEDVRQIVIYIEIVVMECRILLRIEGLKQCRRRITLEITAELIYLVEHNHRI